MRKQVWLYGLGLGAGAIALSLLQYKTVMIHHSLEWYGGTLALVFSVLGIFAGQKLTQPKQIVVEKTVTVAEKSFILNEKLLEELSISKREHEILRLMSEGYSNQEIADKAFISLNTVKTHTSNLFFKLDVKRRTQAIMKAKELALIP